MTTQGKWVTDAGDPRVGVYVCSAYRGANCSDGLLGCGELLAPRAPFYELHGALRHGGHVLCPACALKHFGVTPPGVERFGVWLVADAWGEWRPGWVVIAADSTKESGTREEADARVRQLMGAYVRFTYEVRPYAEPPESDAADVDNQASIRSRAQADALAIYPNLAWHYAAARHDSPPLPALAAQGIADAPAEVREMAPKPCGYAPCGRPQDDDEAHAGFCSGLCADTDRRTRVVEKRLRDFIKRITEARLRTKDCDGVSGEVRWAEQKTADDLDAIDRQWRALRGRDGEGGR